MQMSSDQHVVPNTTGTESPKLKAPAGAADCHIHIYEPRFQPQVARPTNATVTHYRLWQKRMGTTRVVIVQPRNYATDNAPTLDAISQLGIANARGVGVLHPTVTDADLKRLHEGGIRGIRFTTGDPRSAVTKVDMIEPLAKRIAPFGWHVQLNMPVEQIVEHAGTLRKLPVQMVFDHMGKVPGIEHPAFDVIRGLLDERKAWVKISGAYFITKVGPPTYADATSLAMAYLKSAPERCVWGSNWPHPWPKDPPDDAEVFDLLTIWAPDEATRRRILVSNPAALYGF
jgi:predicted TIM-barrel fold metal-dependent hydrolase